jgi:IS1 family transposase
MAQCDSNHSFENHFCVNESCPLYGRQGGANIRLKGHYGPGDRVHELICSNCNKAFSETHGTPFYRTRLSTETFISVIRHLLEGCGIRPTARLLGLHRDTVLRCLRVAASHVLVVLNSVLVELDCPEVQFDEFWSFVLKKEKNCTTKEILEQRIGDRWVHLAIDAVSRLIVSWQVDRRTQEATDALVSETMDRLAEPKATLYTSDQHEPYIVAIEREIRVRTTTSTSSPSTPSVATNTEPATEPPVDQAWLYATVKKRYEKGRCVEVERTLQIGTPEALQRRLDASPVSDTINTSFIERLNNTFRQNLHRFARKTLGFSKDADFMEAQVVLQVADYNLVRPHGSLKEPELKNDRPVRTLRTPAMAAGKASEPWTHLQLLTHKVSPLVRQAVESARPSPTVAPPEVCMAR